MKTKYDLNQNIFLMESDSPRMKKITAVATIDEGNYYILSKSGESEEHAKLSGYEFTISDTKLKWIKESKLFATIEDLQKSLFGNIK